MPKQNPYFIPNENYKKTEEIREIDSKYEIPSFEEFMKNYEDLSGGDCYYVTERTMYEVGTLQMPVKNKEKWKKR